MNVLLRSFYLLPLIVAVACTWVFQCAKAPTVADPGGGSMEVVVSLDGNLVDREGSPAAGTAVYLRPNDYLAPIPAKLFALQELRTMDSTHTDSLGHFTFDSIAAGTYMLECLDGEGNGALIDSVVVTNPDSILWLSTDTLKPLGAISGQIQMPENLSGSQISVLVYGLERLVTPDSTGGYTISGLAEGAYSLRIQILGGQGMDVHGTKVTSGGITLSSKAILPGADKIYAPRASGTITIDGKFDEADWDNARGISFSKPGTTENKVTVRALWDNANLYIAYGVEDTSTFVDTLPGIFWFRDAAEIFLDPEHDAADSLAGDDLQFILTLRNDLSIHRARQLLADTIARGIDITTEGYYMEMAIPWTLIGKTPAAGMAMGILFGNDDKDGETALQFDWLDLIGSFNGTVRDAWKVPSAWGELMLE